MGSGAGKSLSAATTAASDAELLQVFSTMKPEDRKRLQAALLSVGTYPACIDVFYEKCLSNAPNVTLDLVKQGFHDDWTTRPNGVDPQAKGTGPGAEGLVGMLTGYFGTQVPNIKFHPMDTLVCGNRVTRVSKVTGTCANDGFLGVAETKGKSFTILAIDVQIVVDGKIKQSWHLEDWAACMEQLKGKPAANLDQPNAALQGTTLPAGEVPECIKVFYDKLLSDAPKATLDLVKQGVADDWTTRPSALDPTSTTTGPGAEGLTGLITGYFGTQVPNIKFERKETLVCGSKVTVVSKVTGTCAVDNFLGVPETKGKSFEILAIDVQNVADGKIKQTWHIEDWAEAAKQLSQGTPPPTLEQPANI